MSPERQALLADVLAQWRAGNTSDALADALVLLDQPRPEPPQRPRIDLTSLTRELLEARATLPPDASPRALDEALALLPILQPDAGALLADAFADLAGRVQGDEARWRTFLDAALHLTGPALDPTPLFPRALEALGHASPSVVARALRYVLNLPADQMPPADALTERLLRLPWRRASLCPQTLQPAPTDDADAERLLARLAEDNPERLTLTLGLLTAARLPSVPTELRAVAALRLADPCGLVGDAAAHLLHTAGVGFATARGLFQATPDADALRADPGLRLQTEWRMWGRWARRSPHAQDPPLPPVTPRDDLGVRTAADDARREAALPPVDLTRVALAPPRPRRAPAAEPAALADAPLLLVRAADPTRLTDALRAATDPHLPDRLPAGTRLVFLGDGDATLLLQLRALEALARRVGVSVRIAGHRAAPMARNAAGLWETPPAILTELDGLANVASEGEILLTPALGARLPATVPASLLVDPGAFHDIPDPLRWVHALHDVSLQGAPRSVYLVHAADALGRALVGRPLQSGRWDRAAEREEAREKDVLRQTIEVGVFVVGLVLIAGLLWIAWGVWVRSQRG